MEEYHKRTVEAVTRDDAEDVQGDSQEEDADEGAQHEGLRDRDNGAEEEAGEGDGGEGVEQSGIQASAQAIVGRIAAGWERFYPYIGKFMIMHFALETQSDSPLQPSEGSVLTMSKAPSFRYTKVRELRSSGV